MNSKINLRKITATTLMALLSCWMSTLSQAQQKYLSDELLVQFKPNQAVRGSLIISSYGMSAISKVDQNTARVSVKSGESMDTAIQRLSQDPDVLWVQPNYIYHPAAELVNGVAAVSYPVVQQSYYGRGSSPILIAEIDSGVSRSQTAFNNSVLFSEGWDFFSADNDPNDSSGHGTWVAGILSGVSDPKHISNNSNIKILPIRALGNGETTYGTTISIVQSIDYAIAKKCRIINASFGMNQHDSLVFDALVRAQANGILVIAAAGNNAENIDSAPYYPASYNLPNMLVVEAVNGNLTLSSFSNFGKQSVHVAAIGENIRTTALESGYATVWGTSMACAYVSRLAAEILFQNPSLTVAQVKAKILDSVQKTPILENKIMTAGIISPSSSIVLKENNSTQIPHPQYAETYISRPEEPFLLSSGVRLRLESGLAGNGECKVYDADQFLIKTIPFSYIYGTNWIHWDGTNTNGEKVNSDVYWFSCKLSSNYTPKPIPVAVIR